MWTPDPATIITREQKEAAARVSAAQELLALLDRATRPILDAYPAAERLSWDAKEAEAAAVLAAVEPALNLAPLLAGELAAQLGQAPTIGQLTERAGTVLAKAAVWRQLISTVSGLRQRFEAQLDAAPDEAGRRAVLATAAGAMGALEQS